jgi:nitrogen fixation protein FixH
MRRRCESLDAWTTRERRVSLPHDAGETLKKQRAADNARRRLDGETDREVRLAAVEQRDSFVSSEHPADAHVDVRGIDAEAGHERRQQDERRIVGHRERDGIVGRRGVEAIGL